MEWGIMCEDMHIVLDLDVWLVTEFGGIMEYNDINIIRISELDRWKDHILSEYKEQVVSVGGSLQWLGRDSGFLVLVACRWGKEEAEAQKAQEYHQNGGACSILSKGGKYVGVRGLGWWCLHPHLLLVIVWSASRPVTKPVPAPTLTPHVSEESAAHAD